MSQGNIDMIRRVYEPRRERDAGIFGDDIHVWQSPELPWGGAYEGRAGAFTFFFTLVGHIQSQVTKENLLPPATMSSIPDGLESLPKPTEGTSILERAP
jgi:hypothetical protein